MKKMIVLALLGALAGCATPVQHETPSGKAESCIHQPKDQVRSRIAGFLIDHKFNLTQQSEYLVQGERPLEGLGALLLASQYDAQPVARLSFNLLDNTGCVRVVSDYTGITNPHSAFEKAMPLNQSQDTAKIQAFLTSLDAQ